MLWGKPSPGPRAFNVVSTATHQITAHFRYPAESEVQWFRAQFYYVNIKICICRTSRALDKKVERIPYICYVSLGRMRLTPEHLNPVGERELELRGLQIPVIENLASHQGTYDTLNLTDNSITVLGNIPSAPRLRSIHIAQNQISSISAGLPPNIPNLVTLVLTDNAISSLASLIPLESLRFLLHLSLVGNPVTQHEHYRDFVVWKVAKGNLHTLDFTRIKDSVRESARKLLTDPLTSLPNALAHQLSIPTTSSVPGAALSASTKAGTTAVKGGKGRLMTPEEKKRVIEALTRAQTTEEVRKLERMLADGLVPEGGMDGAVNGVAVSG